MSIDQIQVQISIARAGIPRAGFGKPLILSHNAPFPELYREYADPSEYVADGGDNDSPEYLALTAFFSQTPKPTRVGIGRAPTKPTQRYVIAVGAGGPRNLFKYTVDVEGEDFVKATVQFTSDANATNDEVIAGLVGALNGVVGKTYTAVATGGAGVQVCTVTADAVGNWFSLALGDVAAMKISQTHADPGVGADLDAIRLVNNTWYQVHSLYNSKAYVGGVATWAAANGVTYTFDVNETDAITTVVAGATDTGAEQLGLGRSGVMGTYHQRPAAMASAAWMGRWLPTLPGASNPAWKTLEGVEPTVLTSTHKANLAARRMNYYYETANELPITWKGMVFSTVYKYIDVRRNVDWLTDEIQKNIAGKFAAAEGIGFDDPGIQVAAGGLEESLQLGIERKVLLAKPKYTMEVPLSEDVSSVDREARTLTQLKFNTGLRGFVNEVIPIAGTVTL